MFINTTSLMVKYVGTTGNPKALGLYELSGSTFSLTADTTFTSGKSYYVCLGDYITEARYGYNKLWSGDDSGRSLSGKMSGTLIGIFIKIVVRFKRLTKTQLETITPILDAPRQTLQYYDSTKQQVVTMETYTGDYEVKNNKIITGDNRKNEDFEVSFIAISKRA